MVAIGPHVMMVDHGNLFYHRVCKSYLLQEQGSIKSPSSWIEEVVMIIWWAHAECFRNIPVGNIIFHGEHANMDNVYLDQVRSLESCDGDGNDTNSNDSR